MHPAFRLAAEEGGLLPEIGHAAAVGLAIFAVVAALLSARAARVLRAHGRRGAGLVLLGGTAWLPALAAFALLVAWDVHVETTAEGEKYTLAARILLSFIVVAGTWLAATVADALVFAAGREAFGWSVPTILREASRGLLVLAVVFFVLLGIWKVQFTDVALLTSAIAVVLGIALGPTLGSLVAGITLTTEKPFALGDWIDVEGKQGRVEQITWRSTRIVTRDNESVVFPNSKLATDRIINLSRPTGTLGVRCRVGVHYRTPPLEVVAAVRRALAGTPRVLRRPEPVVRLVEYAESAMVWETRFWIEDPGAVEDIKSDFQVRVWYAFQRAGIEIPFPIRNLVMRERGWPDRPEPTEAEERERRARNAGLLRKASIFAPLPEKSVEWLASQARDEVFLEGEKITRQGEHGDRMFLIVSGQVRVALDAEGTQEVGLLGPGDFFGEMSILTGAPRTASVAALGEVGLISIRARDVAPVLQDQPDFARHLAEHAAKRQMGLDDIAAKARAAGPTGDLETTSHDLLREIVRFFRISGGRSGGGDPGSP